MDQPTPRKAFDGSRESFTQLSSYDHGRKPCENCVWSTAAFHYFVSLARGELLVDHHAGAALGNVTAHMRLGTVCERTGMHVDNGPPRRLTSNVDIEAAHSRHHRRQGGSMTSRISYSRGWRHIVLLIDHDHLALHACFRREGVA